MVNPYRSRWFYFSELLTIIFLFGIVTLLQYYQHTPPCALCVLQRALFAALGICFIVGTLGKWQRCGQLLLNGMIVLLSILGASLAGRQIWLHSHPPALSVITCDASITYLLQVMSWREFLSDAINGGAGCVRHELQLWHLSLGTYALACFVSFGCLAIWQLLGWLCRPQATNKQ
jgi:disulfide bond formation protein DsbB